MRSPRWVDSPVGMTNRFLCVAVVILSLTFAVHCGSSESSSGTETTTETTTTGTMASEMASETAMGVAEAPAVRPGEVPADLPNGLLVTYSPFTQNDQGRWTQPAAARLELISRRGGEWRVDVITDDDSNVFHKAMVYTRPNTPPAILTVGGMGAHVKLWRNEATGWTAESIWTETFDGTDRMRDVEVADLFGDGVPAMAVATHDRGVFAVIRPGENGAWNVQQTPRTPSRIFIHEIEIGDLDGDGTLEVYATPSEPNTMEGAQSGEVVRYVPRNSMEPTVVANLGDRHAKEIYVGDVDGDGRDELYVSVEGAMARGENGLEVTTPVEIRRYEAGTDPSEGVVIARIEGDHLMRFLTVGDIDGDGKKEMVAAGFSKGLWLLRPGANPNEEWSRESIDRDSGGFEHTSLLADLDGDGTDELYVASDNDGELRRYVWINGRPRRTVIHSRNEARSMITWNLAVAPTALLRGQ